MDCKRGMRGFLHLPLEPSQRTALLSTPAAGHRNGRGERETGLCRPSVVRFRCAKLIVGTNGLTPDSIQEALRMYLQPIKNDDPRLDFFTMYKRETVEYDTDYMKNHNEDLNTTLIFVRFSVPFINAQG